MYKKPIKIILVILCFFLFALLCVVYYQNNRIRFNKNTFQGNTTGNLNNKGYFCEYNGTIYFANPSDNYCLYQMTPSCTNIRKLNNDCIESINVDENYIYYMRRGIVTDQSSSVFSGHVYSVMRTRQDGTRATLLYDGPAGVLNLYGNHIYYQRYSNSNAFSFHRIRIDGEEAEQISKNGVYPSCAYQGDIYYANVAGDHNIYRYSPSSGTTIKYMDCNCFMVDVTDHYVYYIDLDANYRLVRVHKSTLEKEYLTPSNKGRCIYYNVYKNRIYYYLEGEQSGLYRMNTDTTGTELVYSGTVEYVNCTSNYTFFQVYGSPELFRVPTNGELLVEQIILQ